MSVVLLVLAFAAVGIAVYLAISLVGRRATAGGMVRATGGANGRVGPAQGPARQAPGRVPANPAPAAALEREPAADPKPPPVPEIRWCGAFDPRSSELDERARLRLIGDLGVVAKEWCVPLLCQAYAEEVKPSHRQAALIALAACRSRAAEPTFRRALESADPQAVAIARDALSDLDPPARPPRRRTVERF